ncbi:hypothetical protein ROJ8625_03882 [Roseivivax jejudonensis]|uniref:Anti-sigma factor n=1 Tax=Roseivivax jejudonensis TaxID=1529041 RepID=A0A1X7A7S0_9RHOB|nr:hypothetical protein [Roseivivax jejudonensis]SLN72785.1 hypothetical protein ROJ8625_03882 [Roseivivax jejudonensis]
MIAHDDTLLAAEAALGLLSADERRVADRRIADEPELRAEHALWQRYFAGMLAPLPEVTPPARVKSALEARLFDAPARSFWADMLAPENRRMLLLVVAAKIAVLAALAALLL